MRTARRLDEFFHAKYAMRRRRTIRKNIDQHNNDKSLFSATTGVDGAQMRHIPIRKHSTRQRRRYMPTKRAVFSTNAMHLAIHANQHTSTRPLHFNPTTPTTL